ncbi:MAG TPA: 4'-phosphopantetheinyl transferase superfamily protein [Roseiflexaceae bacterium]|nr:4'-phosphopantetheinyl transferase superfamily protein [Roseiflexaceae bacterium]
MIEWLIQSVAGHPALARGIAPAGLLSEREQLRFGELKTAKRRSDWLIGRWTAKQLIRSYLERQIGAQPLLNSLSVLNDPDGAPRIAGDWRLEIGECKLQSLISNLQLSISHCDGYGFCALSDMPGLQLGADIERVEPRSAGFAEDYFTAPELEQLRTALPESRDTLVTLIWSAKEAALKALRLGLSVDTRKVSCTIRPDPAAAHTWAALTVRSMPGLFGERESCFQGWWRQCDQYVLTLVAIGAADCQLMDIPK